MKTRRAISVVGCHAEGEIGDVIVGGVLPPRGGTLFEQMQAMQRDHDDVRRLLLCEPRGSVARHANLLVPPVAPGCAIGAIIMEPTEYVPSSGSNLICITTVALETGLVPMVEPETTVMIEVPGGVVTARATCQDGKCVSVEIENVASFVDRLDAPLEVEGFGTLTIDVAYGGMFYALVDATRLGFRVAADEARDLAVLGEKVRIAAREQLEVVHPLNPGIRGVSIDSRFRGRILADCRVGDRAAILPAISGRGWITGFHQYVLDADDPWQSGYVLNDTWGVSGGITQ